MPLRSTERSYKNAIDILNSRRRLRRPTAIASGSSLPVSGQNSALAGIPDPAGESNLRGIPSIVGMRQWLYQIGHTTSEIDSLNIIHVAGTKGKGSTCAFIESFLRAFGKRTGFPRKTGLYTSPHLIFPEERIRINFQPIARDLFAKYFFQVWDALSRGNNDNGKNNSSSSQHLPRYLQLIALVSFHAFIKEGVEAAIFETHHGGKYNATNVIEHPIVTVITPLGMDHVSQLGPEIENIAWHKAGIFKSGSIAISSFQEAPSAYEILRARASEKGVKVHFVENDPCLPPDASQLKPDVQRGNCSVALSTVRHFLQEKAPADVGVLSSEDISQGVCQFSWPGRFQLVTEGPFKWLLDSAHNEMSIVKAAEWFIGSSDVQSRASVARALIFSQISQQRDTAKVLKVLAATLSSVHISHVVFTMYSPRKEFDCSMTATATITQSDVELDTDATSQVEFSDIWSSFHSKSRILYAPNIQQALDLVREVGAQEGGMQTLITGSQHLVGGALFFLGRTKKTV